MLLCSSFLDQYKFFIFLQVSYIVRDSNASVVRKRNFLHTPKGVTALAGMKVTACTNLLSPMYCLPVFCTFTIDFEQFEFHLKLDQNQSLAMIFRTSGPWNLETFIITSGLQSLGTWSSESSSSQKLETFIRTSGH